MRTSPIGMSDGNQVQAYLDLTRDVMSGKQKNGAVKMGLKGGYVDLILNEKHPALTPAIKQKVDAVRKTLTSK